MPGTPTGLHAHGISPIIGGSAMDAGYAKNPHHHPRPPSAAAMSYGRPPSAAPTAGWDDASRYSSSIHAAVHPGAGPPAGLHAAGGPSASVSASNPPLPSVAAPPPTGPLPEAPPNFALPPPHALGADQPWMQLPLQLSPGAARFPGRQQAGGVPARRAVGLTPQGTGESGVSVGDEGWSSPVGQRR
jgi:hypothetical protein